MSVKSSTFGAVRLSGDDALKFRNQLTYGKPKQAARDLIERGREMMREASTNGHVVLTLRKK